MKEYQLLFYIYNRRVGDNRMAILFLYDKACGESFMYMKIALQSFYSWIKQT